MKLARHVPGVPLAFAWIVALSLGLAAPAWTQQVPPPAAPGAGRATEQPRKKGRDRTLPPLSLSAAWTVTLPDPAASTPASDTERAYVALRSGRLVALALTDGSVAWNVPAADVAGSPVTGDGLVFAALPRLVQAFDARTGEPRWRAEMPAALGAPLFWDNGWLLAITSEGEATMFRAATGDVLWKQPVGTPAKAVPAAANERVYVLLDDARVVALALQTGATLWESRLPGKPTSIRPLDDRVFVGCTDKFFYCLDAESGKKKWRWRTGGTVVGTAVVDDASVYFLSLDSVLRALDRGNGHQAWKVELPYQPTAGPFLSARLLLVPGTGVELAAFSTLDGKAAGVAKLAGEAAAAPSLLAPTKVGEGGRVLVVTGDGKAQLLVPSLPVLRSIPLPANYSITPAIVIQPEG